MEHSPDHPVVLVVDDERTIADLYADSLADSYDVRTAYSGSQALDELDETVDVVLLDRRMPNVSGDDVLTEIRARGFTCRVAMVTAVEPDFDIVDMGFDDYLTKPIEPDVLRKTVERLLARLDYDEQARKHFALVSKKAVLEREKPSAVLEASDEYTRLTREIADNRERLDGILDDFDGADFRAVYRNLPSQGRDSIRDEFDPSEDRGP